MAVFSACSEPKQEQAGGSEAETVEIPDGPFLMILGNAQDAGFPQAACKRSCCAAIEQGKVAGNMVAAIGILSPKEGKKWLIDATPDYRAQQALMDAIIPAPKESHPLDGILLTHAHIGHYSGLIHLGKEAIGAEAVPLHVMPRMKEMLEQNAPWSQLVKLNNISFELMKADSTFSIAKDIQIKPILVPHRDEFSETVGFQIIGPKRKAIYIPDIDRWKDWDRDLIRIIAENDVAILDGTFFDGDELPNRSMDEVPHPWITTTMDILKDLSVEEKGKVYFTHMNHTNPGHDENSPQSRQVIEAGFKIARTKMIIEL